MIEVGVDVPNATCIVVEDSERFGLAQLHQLRGRVGRGNKQSYCYLVYKESISETAYARIRSLESHSNGFKIAEEDLKLRGAGEYLGNRQSGYNDNLKIASPEDIIVNFNLIKTLFPTFDPDLVDLELRGALRSKVGRNQAFTAIWKQDFMKVLSKIKCPILVMSAIDDFFIDQLELIKKDFPLIRTAILKESRIASPELQTAAIACLIRDFIKEVEENN